MLRLIQRTHRCSRATNCNALQSLSITTPRWKSSALPEEEPELATRRKSAVPPANQSRLSSWRQMVLDENKDDNVKKGEMKHHKLQSKTTSTRRNQMDTLRQNLTGRKTKVENDLERIPKRSHSPFNKRGDLFRMTPSQAPEMESQDVTNGDIKATPNIAPWRQNSFTSDGHRRQPSNNNSRPRQNSQFQRSPNNRDNRFKNKSSQSPETKVRDVGSNSDPATSPNNARRRQNSFSSNNNQRQPSHLNAWPRQGYRQPTNQGQNNLSPRESFLKSVHKERSRAQHLQNQNNTKNKPFWRMTQQDHDQRRQQATHHNQYQSQYDRPQTAGGSLLTSQKSSKPPKNRTKPHKTTGGRRTKKRPTRHATKVVLPSASSVTLRTLSSLFRVKLSTLRETLETISTDVKASDALTLDTIELIAMEYDIEIVPPEEGVTAATVVTDDIEYPPRSPVVALMGHVDHGKTTLLDALRSLSSTKKNANAAVAGTEAGGITQCVSAFQVPVSSDLITFLDTPGHAAFKCMRESGGKITDVLILVISCEDGVSDQTVEIIDLWRGMMGNVGLVVACTKVDRLAEEERAEAMDRIEKELMVYGVMPEEAEFCAVSGKTGEGVEDLLDSVILTSQVMELTGRDGGDMEGVVLDGRVEKGKGVVMDCVVKHGSVKAGDYVVCVDSGAIGRVRMLMDVNGKQIKSTRPSQPVQILGLKTLPQTGETIISTKDEEAAEEILTQHNKTLPHDNDDDDSDDMASIAAQSPIDHQITGTAAKITRHGANDTAQQSLDEKQHETSDIIVPLVIKADADGTLKAAKDCLLAIAAESSHPLIIHPIETSIGPVSNNDIILARESNAIIVSFGAKPLKKDMELIKKDQLPFCHSKIIYRLVDDTKLTIAEHFLPLQEVPANHGTAVVQAVFNLSGAKDGTTVAGLKVTDGGIHLSSRNRQKVFYRVVRKGETVVEGLSAESLKKVKEDVDEARKGEECGLELRKFYEFKKGDVIECYTIEMKKLFV